MTLRVRIAAVASVSVALAVLVAAIGLYVAVRSDLRGEVDSQLRARASAFAGPGGPRGTVPPYGGYPGAGLPPSGAGGPAPRTGGGGSRLPGSVQPAPFGAASGYVQFLSDGGRVYVPRGQGSSPARIAVTALDKRIAKAGSGSRLTRRRGRGPPRAGTRWRRRTNGLPRGGAARAWPTAA